MYTLCMHNLVDCWRGGEGGSVTCYIYSFPPTASQPRTNNHDDRPSLAAQAHFITSYFHSIHHKSQHIALVIRYNCELSWRLLRWWWWAIIIAADAFDFDFDHHRWWRRGGGGAGSGLVLLLLMIQLQQRHQIVVAVVVLVVVFVWWWLFGCCSSIGVTITIDNVVWTSN